jgi:apolipoprotein N-acyltransferase
VRQTGDGLSIATDPYGRVVASMDHFQSSDRVMIAMVPATGVRTPYGTLGDWFGWASLSGLVLLAAVTTAFQVVRRFGRSAFPHRRKN